MWEWERGKRGKGGVGEKRRGRARERGGSGVFCLGAFVGALVGSLVWGSGMVLVDGVDSGSLVPGGVPWLHVVAL